MLSSLLRYKKDGSEIFRAVTLDEIGRNEEFLEEIIAESPIVLNLETKNRGVYGPYKIFRQLNLKNPQGRSILPDIILLCQSGHVVIIEVKLFINPELKNRKVVSQAIDYAATLSSLDTKDVVKTFNRDAKDIEDWNALVEHFFPTEAHVDDLAEMLLYKMKAGKLNIIIACDKVPIGLRNSISSVVKQEFLDFKLEVIEITPYVNVQCNNEEIIFSSRVPIETEIIARSAVTVTIRRDETQPSVEIQTASINEIEENISLAMTGHRVGDRAREWTDEEVGNHFIAHDDPTIKRLFEFCKTHSSNGKITAPGLKLNPVLGMYVTSEKGTKLFLNYIESNSFITLFLDMMEELAEENTLYNLKQKLKRAFPNLIIDNVREPSLKIADLTEAIDKFIEITEWFQSELSKNSGV